MNDYFKYRFGEDIEFNIKDGEFVSIIGNNNDLLVHTLLFGNNHVYLKENLFFAYCLTFLLSERYYKAKNLWFYQFIFYNFALF